MEREDIVGAYRVAEFVTLARDGSPVCWPMMPSYEHRRLVFSTGYMYPTKALNAKRDPRVAALFSDPTASGRSDEDPCVLVQGRAEVLDKDIQRNTERYVAQLRQKVPLMRVLLRLGLVRRAMAGYLARIWIEVTPDTEHVWARGSAPPAALREPARPPTFAPARGIAIPAAVFGWARRYPRQPTLAYVDREGRPVVRRVNAVLGADAIDVGADMTPSEGAPACLTYHRLIGNYLANDSFIIRGHFDGAGRLIPERVVGYGGTADDRGLGSLKLMGFLRDLGQRLPAKLAAEGRSWSR